jgi:hypothetical protein
MRHIVSLFVVCVLIVSPAIAQNEASLCRWLFRASSDFTSTAGSAVDLAAEGVFAASSATGTMPTLTGSLIESPPGTWSYGTSPTDKLVIVFYGGGTVEYTFTHWEGFTDRAWDDFVNSHHMTFTSKAGGSANLSIDSWAIPVVGGGQTSMTRYINGSLLYDGAATTIALTHKVEKQWEVDAGFASFSYQEQCSGTASTAAYQATINDQYYKRLMHNSDDGVYASNAGHLSNSSIVTGGITYSYNNGRVEWAAWTPSLSSASLGIYNKVTDPSFWSASGTLTKNGALHGTVQFSGPVIQDSDGPVLVLAVPGASYLIHPLLQWWLTGVEDRPEGLPTATSLMQNYPNPFNPTTDIEFQVAAGTHVRLWVFDLAGREVAVLVDEKKGPGSYQVTFDASGLASGVYLYQLQTGDGIQTKKMILMK